MTHSMADLSPRRGMAAAVALACAALAGTAAAQAPAPRSALVDVLVGCRTVQGAEARLACYDAAAARFDAAEKSGDVVVVDREQARTMRRQAFGLSLPSLDIFSRNKEEDAVQTMATTAARAYLGPDGKWVVRTAEGQVWRQSDSETLAQPPKAGSKLRIRKGVLTAYFMNIDGQRAIRVIRAQ